jgi:hypothetical protein
MLLHHTFDKSRRSRNGIFGKVGLSRGLQLAPLSNSSRQRLGVGIASVWLFELLRAPVLKLSDGSASGGDSLHDHGSFLPKQDQPLDGCASPFAASSIFTERHASAVTASDRPRCY